MRTHVLDANALYRFLTNQTGGDSVEQVFRDADAAHADVLMSVVNYGEVFYTAVRRVGLTRAANLIEPAVASVPLALIEVTREQAVDAARLKARFNLPYADCFAAVLVGNQGVLVTADDTHFRRVPKLRLLRLPPYRNS